jgi:hypothetical protein
MSVSLQDVSDIIKMVGLVAGGLWAAWTFHKLQKVRAAELEVNQKLTEIQKSRIEQEEIRTRLLRQQPQLAIQLNVAETASLTETFKGVLCVTVTLKNEGEHNLEVAFDDSALTVGRIVFERNGEQTIRDVHRSSPWYFASDSDKPQAFSERIFRSGQKRQMALTVPITEPGSHVVQFRTIYCKIPFEGEKPSNKAPLAIDAIEQMIYFATGKPGESGNAA